MSSKHHAEEEIEESDSSDNEPSFDMYVIPVQRRLGAVKKLHLDYRKQQEAFMKEEAQLREKFETLFQDLFKKRDQIIRGEYEPTEEELATPEATFGSIADSSESTSETTVTGVPDFWKNCLFNSKTLSPLIHIYDLPILEHIISITKSETLIDEESYKALKETIDEDMLPPKDKLYKLTLDFHLSPNDYIENTTLTKILIISHAASGEIDVHTPPFPHDDEDEEEEEEEEEEPKPKKKGKKANKPAKPSTPSALQWKDGKEPGVFTVSVTKTKKTGKGKKKTVKKTTEEETIVLPSFFDLFLPRTELVEKLGQINHTAEHLEDTAFHKALTSKLQTAYPEQKDSVDKDLLKAEQFISQAADPESIDQQFSDTVLFITDTILPNAFYFYTGDTTKYEEDIDDFDDDFDDDDFDDDDDDDEDLDADDDD